MTQGIAFTIPLTPPTVNMYVRHTRQGRHYVSAEAIKFKEAVAIFAKGQSVRAKKYEVKLTIYLGKGGSLDIDNGQKCLFDGLVDAGIIHSDAAIKKMTVVMDRDWENPRTEVKIEAY